MTRLDAAPQARGRGKRPGEDRPARKGKKGRSTAAGEEEEGAGGYGFSSSFAAVGEGGIARKGVRGHSTAAGEEEEVASGFSFSSSFAAVGEVGRGAQHGHGVQTLNGARPKESLGWQGRCGMQQQQQQPSVAQHASTLLRHPMQPAPSRHFYGGQLAPLSVNCTSMPAAPYAMTQPHSSACPLTSWSMQQQQTGTLMCVDATNGNSLGGGMAPRAGVAQLSASSPFSCRGAGSSALLGGGHVVGVQGVGTKLQQQQQQQSKLQASAAGGQLGPSKTPAPPHMHSSSAAGALCGGGRTAASLEGGRPARAAAAAAAGIGGRVGAQAGAQRERVGGSRWDSYVDDEEVAGAGGRNEEEDAEDGFVTAL